MTRDFWDSVVRTLTPLIVGQVLAWLALTGVEVDSEFATSLTLLVGAVLTGVYYLGARIFEVYVSPRFGWLLGVAAAPAYERYVPRHSKVAEE